MESHSWLGQIAVSLEALRFPEDVNQVRAAIKFASDFSWVKKFKEISSARPWVPRLAEGVAVVAHRDNVYIANAGRCRSFLVGPKGVQQLNIPHERTLLGEEGRSSRTETLAQEQLPASRHLASLPSESCVRPQVTVLPVSQLEGALIFAVTPGVVEHFGPQRWQELLLSTNGSPYQEARRSIANAIARSGFPDDAGVLVFRHTPTAEK